MNEEEPKPEPQEETQPTEVAPLAEEGPPKVMYGPPPIAGGRSRGLIIAVIVFVLALALALLVFGFGWFRGADPKVEYGPPPVPPTDSGN